VVRFYNKRGTAEQWIKEGKQGEDDASFLPSVSLEPSAAGAELLATTWKSVAASGFAERDENWSLTSLQQRLVRPEDGWSNMRVTTGYAGGRTLNRRRFGAMLGRIALLPIPTDRSAGRSSSGICCKRPAREKCCKSGGISSNFGGRVRISEPLRGGQYENCFTLSANSGMVYDQCRSEPKGHSGL